MRTRSVMFPFILQNALERSNNKGIGQNNVKESTPIKKKKRPSSSNPQRENSRKSFSWTNISNLLRYPMTNMKRELTKSKLGKRDDQERTSVGGKRHWLYYKKFKNDDC